MKRTPVFTFTNYMFKIFLTLITIRLRKTLPKDDYFAYLFFFLLRHNIIFLSTAYFKFSNYILVISLEIILNHSNIKDLELLKLRKNYLLIVFLEYLYYSLPTILIIIINKDFFNLSFFLTLIAFYTILPKFNSKIIKFPFKFFNPFWTISFKDCDNIFLMKNKYIMNFEKPPVLRYRKELFSINNNQ